MLSPEILRFKPWKQSPILHFTTLPQIRPSHYSNVELLHISMAEDYSGLEVAHTERVHSSPEVIDYSSFAPQRNSLSHESPEVVSQPTFTSGVAHNSLLSDGDGTYTKKWFPQVKLPPRTTTAVTHNSADFSPTRSLRFLQPWFKEE